MMWLMNVTFRCARCGRLNRVELNQEVRQIACSMCSHAVVVREGAIGERGVGQCVLCPSQELYVRKDFPRAIGLAIIGAGILASTVAWALYRPVTSFAILAATALLDLLVYGLVGDVLECYRCHGEYRGVDMQAHTAFQLAAHESQRQQAARLARYAAESINEGRPQSTRLP